MSPYEYHQLLQYLYFEEYVDSYEEAESLLEQLTDEEFEELCEKAPRPTRLPKSRERNIGHDDWKDPDPDTRDWGERPPAGKKLRSRLISTVGTRRREDIETSVRKEDFDIIAEYLFTEGYADSYEDVEYILEKMSNSGFLRKINTQRRKNSDDLKDLIRRKGPEFFTSPKTSATKSARKEEPKTQQSEPRKRRTNLKKVIIAQYLYNEGYAADLQSAEIMFESISEEWMNEIVEKFNPSDYEEYHRKNHRERNSSAEWDAQEKDYQDSRGDIRDKHNQARGVKKKRGLK